MEKVHAADVYSKANFFSMNMLFPEAAWACYQAPKQMLIFSSLSKTL